MFSLFKRTPKFADQAYLEVADMLTRYDEKPTHRRELLDLSMLDYSVESLEHIDDFLEKIREDDIPNDAFVRVCLRTGAYAGEVIRRHSKTEHHWLEYPEAARISKYVKSIGMSLGTAAVLWSYPESMCFPIAKVSKFFENGREDSLAGFARVIISGAHIERS